jgi:GntR family transcriptional regulator
MSNNQQLPSPLARIPSRSRSEEVVVRIEEAIRSSVFKPGQQLPSEPVLADQLGVSRNTLREAINSLIEKGVLYRSRGVGTFVTVQSEIMLQTNLEQVVGTSSIIRSKGYEPGQRGFKMLVENADDWVAQRLQIEPGSKVLHISRIRTASLTPVISSEEYIPMDLLDGKPLPEGTADCDNWSIYEYIHQTGFEISMAMTHIKATMSDRHLAKVLEIKEGQPLLRLEQIHYSNAFLRPVLFCVNYHNDNIIDVEVVRKG